MENKHLLPPLCAVRGLHSQVRGSQGSDMLTSAFVTHLSLSANSEMCGKYHLKIFSPNIKANYVLL